MKADARDKRVAFIEKKKEENQETFINYLMDRKEKQKEAKRVN